MQQTSSLTAAVLLGAAQKDTHEGLMSCSCKSTVRFNRFNYNTVLKVALIYTLVAAIFAANSAKSNVPV